MPDSEPTVFVVDDDPGIRQAMEQLMRSVGLKYRIFASGAELLDANPAAGCLVLDIRMPDMGGLEIQERLAALGNTLPVIFVTGFGDVAMAVDAMQKGAFDFIEKPFRNQELLDRINDALQADRVRRAQHEREHEVEQRIATLTNREREVMELVVNGKPNKVIAHELDVSQRTIEIHRARVMEKMAARSLAELVRMYLSSNARDASPAA